jgi:hypothetical protein
VVTEVRELEWGTELLLLVQVTVLLGLADVAIVALDPLTGGTPILSFGPVMNWGLFRARGVATAGSEVVVVVVKALRAVILAEEMIAEEMVVVVVVVLEVLVAGGDTA